jgi:hypothetical protein
VSRTLPGTLRSCSNSSLKFISDVNLRISLAHSLEAQGWNRPVEEHRSEAELIQLERLYLAYEAESCKPGFDEIEEMPSRVVRFFAGYKGDVEVAQ